MKASLYLTLSALLWGLNFHLLRIMLKSTGFLEAGFWRYLFAVIFLVLFTAKSFPGTSTLKAHFKGILLTSIAGIFLFNVFLFRGLEYTSAINASLIVCLNPLITIFLSSLAFKTPIRLPHITGAVFSMAGVLILLSKGNLSQLHRPNLNQGDGLILLATLLAAFYHIWVKKYAVNIKNQHFTLLTNLVCLLSFILMLPFLPKTGPATLEADFWMAAVTFGGLGTAFTYSIWNKGVKLAGAQKAGLYMNIVPLSTAGITILTGGEVGAYHLISGSFILSGLLISQLSKANRSLIYRYLKGIKVRRTQTKILPETKSEACQK